VFACLRSPRCSPMLTPPTTMHEVTVREERLNAFTSFSIYAHRKTRIVTRKNLCDSYGTTLVHLPALLDSSCISAKLCEGTTAELPSQSTVFPILSRKLGGIRRRVHTHLLSQFSGRGENKADRTIPVCCWLRDVQTMLHHRNRERCRLTAASLCNNTLNKSIGTSATGLAEQHPFDMVQKLFRGATDCNTESDACVVGWTTYGLTKAETDLHSPGYPCQRDRWEYPGPESVSEIDILALECPA
jgi:hypothetical protein